VTALQILIDGFAISALYGIAAIGFTLIFGVSGVLNLSHGAIMVVAAISGWWAAGSTGLGIYGGTLAGIRHLGGAVLGARWTEGVVLRYGVFYGPRTSLAPGQEQFELVRRRRFPVVGDGGGVWSFIHVADAAEATVQAVEHGVRGAYNVVDDDPAQVAEWLPALADQLGAKRPMPVPRLVGRLAAGEAGVVMMTEVRGASNQKAKRELSWRPKYASWRDGFLAA